MIVEEVFKNEHTSPSQRRPNGHVMKRSTKKGHKKRGLRTRLVGLVGEEDASENDEDEDDG